MELVVERKPGTFGEALQGKLEDEGITQTDLAAELRVTQGTISRIINGKRKGSGPVIAAICARWPDLLSFFTSEYPNSEIVNTNRSIRLS